MCLTPNPEEIMQELLKELMAAARRADDSQNPAEKIGNMVVMQREAIILQKKIQVAIEKEAANA